MSGASLVNELRRHRERLGLSQQQLADEVGVSRQAIVAIEAGRQVPATTLSLRLAKALRCDVHDLFRLSEATGLAVRLAPTTPSQGARAGDRVVLGRVAGRWVAHGLAGDGTATADGIVTSRTGGAHGLVEPLTDTSALLHNVLVTGCAPILGMLTQRVGSHFKDARATWLPGGSARALDLLEAGLVHVAGVHLTGPGSGQSHEAMVRSRFPERRMLIVNLTRWREGFVVPPGNPGGVERGEDLLRPGLRFARRESGAGAHRVVEELLAAAGAGGHPLVGPEAVGHLEVAQLVRSGAADVGVAIESVALAHGLDFVPLAEERFDLVVPASVAETSPVSRLIETLAARPFRTEMSRIPGYDSSLVGHVTTLEAA